MKSSEYEITCAIFDMDGLLFDTENLFLDLTGATEEEIGYSIPRELHLEAIGRSFEAVRDLFRRDMGEDFPFDEFFNRTKERVYERVERYGMPVKEGVHELLAALRARGVEIILASSSPTSMIEKNLAAADMGEEFSLTVGGDEVDHGKPSPDIFLLAAKRAGYSPERCIVFEDSNNGVRAGYAAGMRTVMVPDIKGPEEEVGRKAFRIYDSLVDAAREIETLLSEERSYGE